MKFETSDKNANLVKAYFRDADGNEQVFDMHPLDARTAVANHPNEYSATPWPKDDPKPAPVADMPSRRRRDAPVAVSTEAAEQVS